MKKQAQSILAVLLTALFLLTAAFPAFAEDAFTGIFVIEGGNASITVYDTSDYTLPAKENRTAAEARNSATGEIDISGDGQINFTVLPDEGYEIDGVTAEGGYKNLKGPADTGLANTYRVTKITSDVTITITLKEVGTGEEVTPFTGSFVIEGGSASVTVYDTSDYTLPAKENRTAAEARNSATGEIDISGDGQINFTVLPDEGYEIDSVTAEGGYKNLKGPADTGLANTYRATKITSDVTITITLKESGATEEETGPAVITFSNDSVTVSGSSSGITVSGTDVTITAAGTYTLTGSCQNGSVTVAKNADDVTLILDALTLASDSAAPIAAKSGTMLTVTAKEGTENTLTDADRGGESPKACLNSSADVLLNGTGALTIIGNNKNGVKTDGSLTVETLTLTVSSADNGLSADNVLTVESGSITVESREGDCLKSDPDVLTEETQGKIAVNGGSLLLNAMQNDAIQALTTVTVNGGTILAFAGTEAESAQDASYSGIEAESIELGGGLLLAFGIGDSLKGNVLGEQKAAVFALSDRTTAGGDYAVIDADGNIVCVFHASFVGDSIAFSSQELTETDYALLGGGTAAGDCENGLYQDGSTYEGGSVLAEVSLTEPKVPDSDDDNQSFLLKLLNRFMELLKKIVAFFNSIFS